VSVVVLLGGLTGERIGRIARAEGLELVVVDAGAETRTCISVAAADTGELTEIYEDSPAVTPTVLARMEEVLAEHLTARPGWLSTSGRGPSGSVHAVAALVDLGNRCGAQVAVDTHSESLPGAVAARPGLLKINRAEAAEVLALPEDGDLAAMAAELQARSGAAVVLTDSIAGAVAADADGVWRVGPSYRRGRYAVGSGDSFLGGLLAGLEQRQPLAEAVRDGTGCAVANALVPGQGHFDVAVARAVAAEVTVSRLA
jgi:fructose-1-phosphate kinase PfkB-like protein